MIFIGQAHIMRQLRVILPNLYKHRDRGANILLRGPSGYGKTTMAISICRYLSDGNKFEVYWADMTEFRFEKRVAFIDEVHRVKVPEFLFPIMDERRHVLVFATNHDSVLPEAFVNRCYQFIFDEYDDEELVLIARESATFSADDEDFLEIVNAGNRNPRVIKKLIDKMGAYFEENPKIDSKQVDYTLLLKEVFSIEDGLDTHCRRYLESLQDVGGTASLFLISNIMHVDENTLKAEVEPVLLRKGLIRISSRGRSLTDVSNR